MKENRRKRYERFVKQQDLQDEKQKHCAAEGDKQSGQGDLLSLLYVKDLASVLSLTR